MAPPRYIPSDSILEKWLEEGLDHQAIVERIREQTGVTVSRSSVAAAISRAGLSNRVRYEEHIPWSPIRADHAAAYPLSMLRLAAREANGVKLTEDQQSRLDSWRQRLAREGAVVEYRYDSPDGWYYVPARPQDTGLIRIPDAAATAPV